MLKNLFVAVVGGLLLWFVQDHFRDVPTATYSVSDAIEIPGAPGTSEYAQEVTVWNSGRPSVTDISVKVSRHILSYRLTKHSSLTKEVVSDSEASGFELLYPELPAGQRFRLLVRYDKAPLEKGWITVSHKDGNAQPRESQSSSINYLWIWLAYLLGIVTQSVGDVRRWKRESYSKWADDEQTYRDSKPWFASSREWSEMQSEAIRKRLDQYDYSQVQKSACYLLLNRKKPALMSPEHWTTLQAHADDLLMAKFSQLVTGYTPVNSLLDFYSLAKPEGLSHKHWNEFQESLDSRIEDKLLPPTVTESALVNLLQPSNEILSALPQRIATTIRKIAEDRYCKLIINYAIDAPDRVASTARFELLDEKIAAETRKTVIQLARLRSMPQSWQIVELEIFLTRGKPTWMSDDEFSSIGALVSTANELLSQREALSSQQNGLQVEQARSRALADRVVAQLNLIDRVLTNPSTIDKVEECDATFAPGNRENLERVALILKSAQGQQ